MRRLLAELVCICSSALEKIHQVRHAICLSSSCFLSISYLFYWDSNRVAATCYFYYNEIGLQYTCFKVRCNYFLYMSHCICKYSSMCFFPLREWQRITCKGHFLPCCLKTLVSVVLHPAFMKMKISSTVVHDWPENLRFYIL